MAKKNLLSILIGFIFITYSNAQQQAIPLTWIDSNAVSIENNNSNTYLSRLSKTLKGTTILGLGEASHGTHEFFLEKNRIIKHLITYEKYKSLGFEFGYSAIAPINNYLQNGKGDLTELMQPLRLFNTKEIYDLFQWIKIYNDSQSLKNKVNLFGFDTNYIKSDIDASAKYSVNYLIKNAGLFVNTKYYTAVLNKIADAELINIYDLSSEEIEIISKLNEEIKSKSKLNNNDFVQFKKHISLLHQATLLSNPLARDKFMAENIIDFQANNKTKTIIWAHNVHLSKDTTMAECQGMGYHLKEKYSNQYYAIGFDTFQGSVNVINNNEFILHDFEATPGSFSSLFVKAKYPKFFISFNNLKDRPVYSTPNTITNIFANWTENRELPIKPGVDFDGLIFIRETTASIELK